MFHQVSISHTVQIVPADEGEFAAAGECFRSWEKTKSALWAHETYAGGGLLRLQNTTLCLDNRNGSSGMGADSASITLSSCNRSAPSQQWVESVPGAADAPFRSGLDGLCLGVSPGNLTILGSVRVTTCSGGSDPLQRTVREQDGRILLGPRNFCLEAASAVPHRRHLLAAQQQVHHAPPTSPGAAGAATASLLRAQADAFFARLLPLFSSTTGSVGLIVSAGWIMDLVTEWTGDPSQPYPIRNPEAPQFADWRYADVAHFFSTLRQSAAALGLGERLILGWMHIGSDKIYDIKCGIFSQRHPEIFDGPGMGPGRTRGDPAAKWCSINAARGLAVGMRADNYSYASFPHGVVAGTSFQQLYGAQWGKLSNYLQIDLVLLRDGVGRDMYVREGPFGFTASPNVTLNTQWRDGLAAWYREAKLGNPHTLVYGYSSAASAVGELRVSNQDLEAYVAEGYIDGWVDQTWAGAWQDVRDREFLMDGWTPQLAYTAIHHAQISGGNRKRRLRGQPSSGYTSQCVHLALTETFDSYEHWDTIHHVAGKLAWGMIAFQHAAVVAANGSLDTMDGSYISWGNQYTGSMLSVADVSLLTKVLNLAQESAEALETIYGPVTVYLRSVSR